MPREDRGRHPQRRVSFVRMVRSFVLSLCIVVGCGGKAPAPPAPEPESGSGSDAECNDLSASEWPCGVEPDDADCTEGPAATTFAAEGSGDRLWINACAWDAAGPAQVITMDGRILSGTAEIDSELDASYTIDAKGFHPPSIA